MKSLSPKFKRIGLYLVTSVTVVVFVFSVLGGKYLTHTNNSRDQRHFLYKTDIGRDSNVWSEPAFQSGEKEARTEVFKEEVMKSTALQPEVMKAQIDSGDDDSDSISDVKHPEQASLWVALAEARYSVEEIMPAHQEKPQNVGAKYFAANPQQQMTARFYSDKVRVEAAQVGQEWLLDLSLESSSINTEPVKKGNSRVEYDHGNVTEWLENTGKGLEQGFVLHHRLEGSLSKYREVTIRVDGGLGVEVDAENEGDLRFVNSDGVAVAGYKDLKVWDANGDVLEAKMKPHGNSIVISVRQEEAKYPIIIDPTIFTFRQTVLPVALEEGVVYGSAGDRFGSAVSLDGDRALIGSPRDDSLEGINSGSAYIFDLVEGHWELSAKLVPETVGPFDHFGVSVSLDGDIALIGTGDVSAFSLGFNSGGYASVFQISGGRWTHSVDLRAPEGTPIGNRGLIGGEARFGFSVSLSGNKALIGAPGVLIGSSLGAAFLFDLVDGSWLQTAVLEIDSSEGEGGFGHSVSLSGTRAVIGALPFSIPSSGNQAPGGVVYVFDEFDSLWSQTAKLLPDIKVQGEYFGQSVSLSGDRVIVGAPNNTFSGFNHVGGSAYIFDKSDGIWEQSSRLVGESLNPVFNFGVSVSLDGARALVGSGSGFIGRTSSAYVFEEEGGVWSQTEQLELLGEADGFQRQVSLSGNRALVGGLHEDELILAFSNSLGSAVIFDLTGGEWKESEKFTLADSEAQGGFGGMMSFDGDRAVISASTASTEAGLFTGVSYIFDFVDGLWARSARLLASDTSVGDGFGSSVALAGNRVFVGASEKSENEMSRVGAVYAFDLIAGDWLESAKLIASEALAEDNFGRSLSAYEDRVLIGAPALFGSGNSSAYVFDFVNGMWEQSAKLEVLSDGDNFGNAVSLFGNRALIGTKNNAVFVFDLVNGIWDESAKLVASDDQGSSFGESLSLEEDRVLIGSPMGPGTFLETGGSAYVFDFNGTSWVESAKLIPSGEEGEAQFGASVSLDGDRVLIGSPEESSGSMRHRGAAYVFDLQAGDWVETSQINSPSARALDYFGSSVSLSDGRALIGAIGHDQEHEGDLLIDIGAVFFFELSEAFTEMVLDNTVLSESVSEGTLVGTLTAFSSGLASEFRYSLVDGIGSEENIFFTVDDIGAGRLYTAGALDFEESENYSIRARVVDQDGNGFEEVFRIRLIDDRMEDADRDGLTEEQEEDIYGTSDDDSDSDDDGFLDGYEVFLLTDLKDELSKPSYARVMESSGYFGNSAESHSDPAKRGITNGLAYALGIHPVDGLTKFDRDRLPEMTESKVGGLSAMRVSIPVIPPDDVVYSVEVSESLGANGHNWEKIATKLGGGAWSGIGAVDISVSDPEYGFESTVFEFPTLGQEQGFIRLGVEIAPAD